MAEKKSAKKPATKTKAQPKSKAKSKKPVDAALVRTPEQIERDRELIADLTLKRVSLRKIGERVDLSHTHVAREIEEIRKIWARQSEEKLQAILDADLRRLELIEAEAWVAWATSLEISISTNTVTTDKYLITKNEDGSTQTEPVTEVKTTVSQQPGRGDAKYLQIIKDCIVERHKLLGTYDREEEEDEEALEAVELRQRVYFPGLGEVTPELMLELMKSAEGAGLYQFMESLLQKQDPFSYFEEEPGDDTDA